MAQDDRAHWATFGRWVQAERERRGLQKAAMARNSDPRFSASWLTSIENGGRVYKGEWVLPSPERAKLIGLANALGKDSSEVLARADGLFVESPSVVLHDTGQVSLGLTAPVMGEMVELLADVALRSPDLGARERARLGLLDLQEAIRRLPPELQLDALRPPP